MRKFHIYLIGIIAFGLAYSLLKKLMVDWLFFLMSIAIILLIRVVAERFGK